MSDRPSGARQVALGLATVALLLGAGEVATRALGLVDRLNGYPRTLYAPSEHPGVPYRLRPGAELTARGVPVRVNELGLRGGPAARRPAPGTRRVLVLGDSVAFGYRLPEEDAFAFLLEGALESRTGERFEVLNAGVEGYDTRSELAWLEAELLDLEPEAVVLLFNLNDYDEPPVLGARGVLTANPARRAGDDALAYVSELYLLLRALFETGGALLVGGGDPDAEGEARFSDLDRVVSAMRKDVYRAGTDPRLESMVRALGAMHRATAARGIRLVVAIVPDGDQVGVAAPDLAPQERLRAACRELELECLDLQPLFAAQASEPLFLDIMHPNAAGQRIMAQAVARSLTGG